MMMMMMIDTQDDMRLVDALRILALLEDHDEHEVLTRFLVHVNMPDGAMTEAEAAKEQLIMAEWCLLKERNW